MPNEKIGDSSTNKSKDSIKSNIQRRLPLFLVLSLVIISMIVFYQSPTLNNYIGNALESVINTKTLNEVNPDQAPNQNINSQVSQPVGSDAGNQNEQQNQKISSAPDISEPSDPVSSSSGSGKSQNTLQETSPQVINTQPEQSAEQIDQSGQSSSQLITQDKEQIEDGNEDGSAAQSGGGSGGGGGASGGVGGGGSTQSEAVCGNNILEPGEECDDGNQIPGDGCSDICTLEFSSNLVAHWGFDELSGSIIFDSTINSNDGVMVSTPARIAGILNNSMRFDGASSEAVSVPQDNSMNFGTGSFSISLWINYSACTGTCEIIRKGGAVTGNTKWYALRSLSGTIDFRVTTPAGTFFVTDIGTTNDDNWHHLVAVRDTSTNDLIIYLDGFERVRLNEPLAMQDVTNSGDLVIAARTDLLANFYTGSVDDIRLYDGVLTLAEINQLYDLRLNQCGDGYNEATEECDDGNNQDYDSCSSTCTYEELPDCTIRFDESCPDTTVECFAQSFGSSHSCFDDTSGTCHVSGTNSLQVTPPDPVSFVFDGLVNNMTLRRGLESGTQATIRFFDRDGTQLGSDFVFSNACNPGTMAISSFQFSTPLRLMTVTTDGVAYIDDMQINRDSDLGFCGDSIVNNFEECDDGNFLAGDGCSHLCYLENLSSCTVSFDGSCPSSVPECGSLWTGGDGCIDDTNGVCHVSGQKNFRVSSGNDATINFSGIVNNVTFFARGDSLNLMFYDKDHTFIAGISPAGSCSALGLAYVFHEFTALKPAYMNATTTNIGVIDEFTINSDMVIPPCGNNVVDPGEECDDGNLNFGDGCDSSCMWENLSSCTVSFDTSCPVAGGRSCDTIFNGGVACVDDTGGQCHTTGNFYASLDSLNPFNLDFKGHVNNISLFHAVDPGSTMTLRFFDVLGSQIGSDIISNEVCTDVLVPNRFYSFPVPAHSATITTDGTAKIDAIWINIPSTLNYCGDGSSLGPNEECDDRNTVSGDGCDYLCNHENLTECFIDFEDTCPTTTPECNTYVLGSFDCQTPINFCTETSPRSLLFNNAVPAEFFFNGLVNNITFMASGSAGSIVDLSFYDAQNNTVLPSYSNSNDCIVSDSGIDQIIFPTPIKRMVASTDSSSGVIDSLTINPSTSLAICGDSIVEGSEECDDGGIIPGDGCDDSCMWENLSDCTIDFDGSCPVITPECDSFFTGSATCEIAPDFCSVTGTESLRIPSGSASSINFNGHVNNVTFYYAGYAGSFINYNTYDESGSNMGGGTTSNRCNVDPLDMVHISSSTPIHRISFFNSVGEGYVDSIRINSMDPAPGCGNGVVEPFEECDDNNLILGDGCDDLCRLEGPITYYVDNIQGDDLNDGRSPATAWESLSKISSETFNPGDRILLNRGDYWREKFVIPQASGTASEKITFGAYGTGSDPVIAGFEATAGWVWEFANTYSTILNSVPENNEVNVVIENSIIRLKKQTSIPNVDSPGEFFYDSGSNTLYVNTYNNNDPSAEDIRAAMVENVITICDTPYTTCGQEYLIFENLTIFGANGNGMMINDSSNIEIYNVTFNSTFGSGLNVSGSSIVVPPNNIFVEDNYFYHSGPDVYDVNNPVACINFHMVSNSFIDLNDINNCMGPGIKLDSSSSGPNMPSFFIRRNNIKSSIVGIHVEKTEDSFLLRNNITNGNNTGIYIGEGSALMRASLNLIYDIDHQPNTPQIHGIYLNDSSGSLFNNLIYSVVGSSIKIEQPPAAGIPDWVIKNNILHASNNKNPIGFSEDIFTIYLDGDKSMINSNFNLHYMPGGNANEDLINWDGTLYKYYEWIDFVTAEVDEGKGFGPSVHPEFIDELGRDFHLNGSSTLIDRGDSVSLVSDFDKITYPQINAHDIGPYEFVLSGCGDSYIEKDGFEECDDGNTDNGDGCNAACTIEFTGMEAHYPLDEPSGTAVMDISGNGIDGTTVNNPVRTQGIFSGAIEFDDALDQAIDIPPAGGFDFGGGDFSVSMWINFTDCPYCILLQKGNDADSPGWFQFEINNNILYFVVNSSGAPYRSPFYVPALNDGKWHHIVGTKDPSADDTIDLYVDGKLVAVELTSSGSVTNPANLVIGANGSLDAFNFDGVIDDIRLYPDILFPTDVKRLFDASRYECGNQIVESGEDCDDGMNGYDLDYCNDQCEFTDCSDGLIQFPNGEGVFEQCDDGNVLSGDGCSGSCVIEFCGDGLRHAGIGEECDDGNTIPGDGCDENCLYENLTECTINFDSTCPTSVEECGTNIIGSLGCVVDPEPLCHQSGTKSLYFTSFDLPTIRFDGLVNNLSIYLTGRSGSSVDLLFFDQNDAQVLPIYNTVNDCSVSSPGIQFIDFSTPIVQMIGVTNGDAFLDTLTINPSLVPANCGNSIPEIGEECDDGANGDDSDLCMDSCTHTYCGDGIIQRPNGQSNSFEECDDGNSFNGDGCSNTCIIEYSQSTLRSHWKFDDGSGSTALDYSTNTNDGTLLNNPSWTPGVFGTAIDFDSASSNAMSFNNDPTINFDTDSFTVSLWINFTSCLGTCDLLRKGGAITGNSKWYAMRLINNVLDFRVKTPSGTFFTSGIMPRNDNIWHHIVGVRDISTNDLILYVDGIEVSRYNDALAMQDVTSGGIGSVASRNDFAANFYDGVMDDVRLYLGILSPNEIQGMYNLSGLVCGDGDLDPGEVCDDGNFNDSDTCYNNCTDNVCGDGFVNIGVEDCDDGNNINGDGCSAICISEISAPLAGHWRLDDVSPSIARDSSIYRHDGNLVNSPTWVDGIIGSNAIELDSSSSQAITIDPPNDQLNFDQDSFSISMWVNFSDCNPCNILRKGSSTNSNNFYFIETDTNNDLRFAVRTDITPATSVYYTNDLNDSRWHHIVAVRDTIIGFLRLYVDGNEVDTFANPSGNINNNAIMAIGARDTLTDRFFDGYIDDVRVYDGVLTPADVNLLYGSSGYACGNSVEEASETCDDGANGNDFDQCYDNCTLTICGDSNQQSPNGFGVFEACDDGNTNEGDACLNNCSISFCGDSIQQTPNGFSQNEECDDGANGINTDECTDSCTLTFCGDSVVQTPNGFLQNEACDDGANGNNLDQCTDSCTLTFCGDGFTQSPNGNLEFEDCDDGANGNPFDQCDDSCQNTFCGDGFQQSPNGFGEFETCDDGNSLEVDGCLNNCTISFCGDGVTQSPNGFGQFEGCDDGNSNDNDACKNNCAPNVCGDGIVNPFAEQCDDGNSDETDACLNDCTFSYCGDSTTQPINGLGGIEFCDDGANGDDSDQCFDDCTQTFCSDTVIQSPNGFGQNEICDDGNLNNDDTCSDLCQPTFCGDAIIQAPNGNGEFEDCEPGNLNGETCITQGGVSGTLGCYASNCTFDISACVGIVQVCGNSNIEAPETCDDGANGDDTDQCFDNCTITYCGDGTTQSLNGQGGVEECDDNNIIPGDGCDASCVLEFCGDNIYQPGIGEQCDDGNTFAGDGCNATCQDEFCGDFVANDVNEECDDGQNGDDTDQCTDSCTFTFCGDTVTQSLNGFGGVEECDDGQNGDDSDACTDLCQETFCGDFITQNPNGQGVNEECDDGMDGDPFDDCTDSCTQTFCGDGTTQPLNGQGVTEQCDDGNLDETDGCLNNCQISFCGDGIHQPLNGQSIVEECDDGNADETDGCSSSCTLTFCGDLIIQQPNGNSEFEDCEDTNLNGNDCMTLGGSSGTLGCYASNCTFDITGCFGINPICGNNVTEFPEECDDQNLNESDTCYQNCTLNICGDGNIDLVEEECDDNNTDSNDGCSSSCEIEYCGDGIVQSSLGEVCDDNNTFNNDSCLDTCQPATCQDGYIHIGVEDCEGTDLNGTICTDLGYDFGTLGCNANNCTFNNNSCEYFGCGDGFCTDSIGENCTTCPGDCGVCLCNSNSTCDANETCSSCPDDCGACGLSCGNNITEAPESCDLDDLSGMNCTLLGYLGGNLSCSLSCGFNVTGCWECGNGVVDPGEECDVLDFNGSSCVSEGRTGGTLSCTSSCTFNYSTCTSCGDSICNGNEACNTCPGDCGSCAPPSSGGGGGSPVVFKGGGGGSPNIYKVFGSTCGNNYCNFNEDCEDCPEDCGECVGDDDGGTRTLVDPGTNQSNDTTESGAGIELPVRTETPVEVDIAEIFTKSIQGQRVTTAEVEVFLGFVNWITIFFISALFLGLLIHTHYPKMFGSKLDFNKMKNVFKTKSSSSVAANNKSKTSLAKNQNSLANKKKAPDVKTSVKPFSKLGLKNKKFHPHFKLRSVKPFAHPSHHPVSKKKEHIDEASNKILDQLQQLDVYIENARKAGFSDQDIAVELKKVGWVDEVIKRKLNLDKPVDSSGFENS